ncbi:MAG: hypothetical protein V4813_14915 [Gemmatimonadota bacterium]
MDFGGILKIVGMLLSGVALVALSVFGVIVYRGFLKNRANTPAESFAATANTPQGAARMFHDAVRRRDLDAMVGMRAFDHEATAMLERQGKVGPEWTGLGDSTAAVLSQAFRAEWANREWPDLRKARAYFGEPLSLGDNIVTMSERIEYPGRNAERSQLYLVQQNGVWKLFVQ